MVKELRYSNNELITSMVRNSKIEEEVQSDEEDDFLGANDKCLEKPIPIAIRGAIESIMDFSFFTVSEKMQGCTMYIYGMVENELAKNMKQASAQILAKENFERSLIDDKLSSIYDIFFILSPFFSYNNDPILTKTQIIQTFDKSNHFLRSREGVTCRAYTLFRRHEVFKNL